MATVKLIDPKDLKIGDRVKHRRRGWESWCVETYTVLDKHPRNLTEGKCAINEQVGYLDLTGAGSTEYGLIVEEPEAMIKKIGSYFYKRDGWKAGDKVLCTDSNFSVYKVGEFYRLEQSTSDERLRVGNWAGTDGEFKKVEEQTVVYEDKWHLNDGSPIPEDADTLEKDGSIVAYRKVKKPVVEVYDRTAYWNEDDNEYYYTNHGGQTRIKLVFTKTDGKLTNVEASIVES